MPVLHPSKGKPAGPSPFGTLRALLLAALWVTTGCESLVRPNDLPAPPAGDSADPEPADDPLLVPPAAYAARTVLAGPVDATAPQLWEFRVVGLALEARAFLTLTWDFGDGGAATGEWVTHAYSDGGRHTFTLLATDDGGRIAFRQLGTVAVEIPPEPIPPELTALFESALERADEGMAFRGVARTSPLQAGEVAEYAWTFADGAIRSGPNVAHLLREINPFRVTLVVTTSTGRTAIFSRAFVLPPVKASG